jgi:cysteine-rich repeat protein/parallel beta-helix repeat protein
MLRLTSLTIASFLALTAVASADTIIAGGNLPGAANTWTSASSPYILQGDVTVPAGATLTIEAGVEVRATANSDSQGAGQNTTRVELLIDGALDVNGTVANPVTFRSTTTTAGTWYGVIASPSATSVSLEHANIQHAIFGLVTQAPGTVLQTSDLTIQSSSSHGLFLRAGNPVLDRVTVIGAGNYGIYVGDSSSPTLTRCVVRNSVNYGVYVAHTTPGRSLALDNCTLNANGSFGVYTSASTGNAATISITDSIITNASYGVYRADAAAIAITNSNVWNNPSGNYVSVSPGANTISSNPLYVSATDLRLTSNSPSRFGASGAADQGALPYDVVPTPGLYGTLWSNTTLTAAQSPFTAAGDLIVAPDVTLTIEPGVTLAFQANSDIMLAGANTSRGELTVRGRLLADGTPAGPITIASTSATSGTWYGLDLEASAHDSVLDRVTIGRAIFGLSYRSTGTGNVLTHVTADGASSHGLFLRTGSPMIDGWRSIGAGNYGIYVGDSSSPTLTNCIVRNSVNYGVYVAHTAPGRSLALSNCTLNANGSFGVYTSASTGNAATIAITNSIITNASYGVYRADAAAITITYSDVWNNSSGNYVSVWGGIGTIPANPQYVSATDPTLQATSVAIDSGTTGVTGDADGVSRPLDGNGIGGTQWDMGAYELVLTAQCGNAAIEPGEACDSGANNGLYGYCNATCSAFGPRCGDGTTNGPEQCDDANTSNTDACLNTCITATCGDGVIRAGVEQCDDANTSNTDACTNTCAAASCGDGYVRAGIEACDDGNATNTDACLDTCVAATCSDGYVYTGVEQCDDANPNNTDACLNTCLAATCGDGFVRTGTEQCDDGNTIATDACTATCTTATCGDGIVRAGVEECDDTNTSNADACVGSCQAASCGDGYVQSGVGAATTAIPSPSMPARTRAADAVTAWSRRASRSATMPTPSTPTRAATTASMPPAVTARANRRRRQRRTPPATAATRRVTSRARLMGCPCPTAVASRCPATAAVVARARVRARTVGCGSLR